jgi:hypothetical protein
MDPAFELMLWRWSTAIQAASAVMIAVFFIVIARTARRAEAQPWGWAWLANLFALLVTVTFWYTGPNSRLVSSLLGTGYFLGKTSFLLLLVLGARAFAHPGAGVLPRRWRILLLSVLTYSILAGVFLRGIPGIGTAQSVVNAAGCIAGAAILLGGRTAGSFGLVLGFSLRGTLAAIEALAYGTQLTDASIANSDGVRIFLASHSSLDTGAEWVIALGCVLTLYRHIQLELTEANQELNTAHEALQGLVDRDPLTGLANRRALPAVLRDAFAAGATILFFDLNDFKEVNDSFGHRTGDDCLKRFALALRSGFRPNDDVLRFAGDEFVVVARGVAPEGVLGRIDPARAGHRPARYALPWRCRRRSGRLSGEPSTAFRR